MTEQTAHKLDSEVTYSGNVGSISVTIGPVTPEPQIEADTKSAVLTRQDFEDALDKASRPVKTAD